jgi:hypothetical protein
MAGPTRGITERFWFMRQLLSDLAGFRRVFTQAVEYRTDSHTAIRATRNNGTKYFAVYLMGKYTLTGYVIAR